MSDAPWRIVVVSTVPPVVEPLVPFLRELGHEPVAVVSARYEREREEDAPPEVRPANMLAVAPAGLDLLFPSSKWQLAPLLRAYKPDLVLC